MQGATLSHPRCYPHILAPALNNPHNKARGSDKNYCFQPSHLEARGKANLSLDVLRGKQIRSPQKVLEAEHMPHTARWGCEKIDISICRGVHNVQGEALWAAERYHNKLEGDGCNPPPSTHFQVGGECWIVFCVHKSLKKQNKKKT